MTVMQKNKYQSLKVRTISTVIIIASFSLIIYWGHVPLMIMILTIQVRPHVNNAYSKLSVTSTKEH